MASEIPVQIAALDPDKLSRNRIESESKSLEI